MSVHRPQTLTHLKSRSWRHPLNDLNDPFGQLWKSLDDNCATDAENAVINLKDSALTVPEFEDSTVLLYAVHRGWQSTVHALLRLADTFSWHLSIRNTAFREAIQSYQHHIVEYLLDSGADINANIANRASLFYAVKSQVLEMVEHIIAKCADINDLTAVTILDYPTSPGFMNAVLRLLVDRSADLNERSNPPGTILRTPAWISSRESVETMKYIFSKGATCGSGCALISKCRENRKTH